MNRLIIDTSAYVRLGHGNTDIRDALDAAVRVYMSVIVLGELHSGFRGGSRKQEKLEDLSRFLAKARVETLSVTDETASVYGSMKTDLKRRGSDIPSNDIWLAAQAMENGAVLVTYDRHFDRVPGLRRWPEFL